MCDKESCRHRIQSAQAEGLELLQTDGYLCPADLRLALVQSFLTVHPLLPSGIGVFIPHHCVLDICNLCSDFTETHN